VPRFVRLAQYLSRSRPDIDDIAPTIASGRVLVDGRVITNPAALVRRDARVVVQPERVLRGTAKLAAALDGFAVRASGRTALDLGASAGGFTSALLSAGAARVYAVDAGVGQLAGWLRQDPRVVNLEGVNLGDLDAATIPAEIGLLTIDLSYLSVADAVPQLERLHFDAGADLIALVKPMYELGRSRPPRPDEGNSIDEAVRRAAAGIESAPWLVEADLPSPVRGRHGAVEWLLHARRCIDYIIS
jgi:23S rRNA (cytidine1920-2'-O)/16S rRNA (cytidine1409-2'-O)-methyltransferase